METTDNVVLTTLRTIRGGGAPPDWFVRLIESDGFHDVLHELVRLETERDQARTEAARYRALLRAVRDWLTLPEPWAGPFGGNHVLERIDAALAAETGADHAE